MPKLRCMIIHANGEFEEVKKPIEESRVLLKKPNPLKKGSVEWKPLFHLKNQIYKHKKFLFFKTPLIKRYNVFFDGATEDANPETQWILTEGFTRSELMKDAKKVNYRNMGGRKEPQVNTFMLILIVLTAVSMFAGVLNLLLMLGVR